MKMTKVSVIAAMALGALLACSTAATAQETNKGGGKRGFPSVQERLDRMTTELTLTDEQKPKVKAALEEQDKAMQGVRDLPQDERREKMRTARQDLGKKLKDILTPEQYTKWEQMRPAGKKCGGTEKKN